MSAMTDFLENQLASHIFGSGTFIKRGTLAIALTATPPTDADTGASARELPNQGAYARQALNPGFANWTDPVGTDGLVNNLQTVTFPDAQSEWGWVSGVLICDSATYGGGNAITYGTLTTPKYIGSGDAMIVRPSGFSFTFA